jgi:ankyrin repeat protein
MYAVFEGHLPVVRLLISRGADVNAVAHTLDLPRRSQPSAAIFGSRFTGGFTALTFAARQDYVEIARALLEAGANPNVSDRDGMTPLIVAVLNGSFETAAVILEKGADPNDGALWETMEFRNYRGEEDNGRILPEITSKLDSLSFVKMLLAHGADPTQPYGKLRTLHKYAGTGLGRPVTTSALDRALDAVDLESLRLMLDSAVARRIPFDPNAVLMAEVRAFQSVGPGKMVFRTVTDADVADAIKMAIGYGANVNSANPVGNTPLHLAAQQGANEIVKLLAAQGAKLDAKNKAGLTPVDFAMGKGGPIQGARGGGGFGPAAPPAEHPDTAALLRQLMAGPSALNAAPEKQ